MHSAAEDKSPKAEKDGKAGNPVEQLTFKGRFVLVFGEIDDQMARNTCERLIALSQESDSPITMLISSPGGHVESGDAIHDVIRFVRAPVTTVGTGWVASAGTHIFLAPPKDIAIQAKEIIKTRERIAAVVARQTGQPLAKVLADMERDYWMSPEEAIAYGVLSRVVERQQDLA
jgi:ATP-dependent Clp protease, protease subunit